MSFRKNLEPEDVLISSFQVHKSFTFTEADSGSGVYAVNLVKGSDKLKGAGVKGKLEYTTGRHSISGQGSFKPDRKEGSAGLTYKFKF